MDFFQETEITANQAEVIARGMLAIARAEGGVRDAEMALIRSFYSDVTGGDARQLAALHTAPDLSPETAATALTSDVLARLFLKSCILAGYADGTYAPQERAEVERYAVEFVEDCVVDMVSSWTLPEPGGGCEFSFTYAFEPE